MGLLDSITEDQLLGGLLGAGAASGAKGNFLSRLAAGIGAGEKFSQGRQEQARQRSQDEMQAEYRKLMMLKMQRDEQQAMQAQRQGEANTGAIRSGLGNMDPREFLQKNPGADIAGLEQFVKLSQATTPKASKFSTSPQADQNGRMYILSDDGQIKYLDGVKARDKLVSADLGGKVGFRTEYSPDMVGMADKTMTPDAKASNALGWANNALTKRGQDMTNARASEGTWSMNNDTGYMVNSRTGEYRLATGPDGKPTDRPVKLTEQQGKATGFAARMQDAEKTLKKFEDKVSPSGVAMAGYKSEFPSWLPGGQIFGGAITAANRSFNPAVTEEAMAYQQAQENWVTANLRLESGAVIGPEEMQKEIQKYFPVPGDPKSIRDQKKAARAVAERAVSAQSGPGQRLITDIAGEQAADATKAREIPPAAINDLRMRKGDPKAAAQFDEVFGEGAAARALRGN